MLTDKMRAIYDRLVDKHNRKATIARVKAQAEIETIQREHEAYMDGVYDALRAIEEKEGAADG